MRVFTHWSEKNVYTKQKHTQSTHSQSGAHYKGLSIILARCFKPKAKCIKCIWASHWDTVCTVGKLTHYYFKAIFRNGAPIVHLSELPSLPNCVCFCAVYTLFSLSDQWVNTLTKQWWKGARIWVGAAAPRVLNSKYVFLFSFTVTVVNHVGSSLKRVKQQMELLPFSAPHSQSYTQHSTHNLKE